MAEALPSWLSAPWLVWGVCIFSVLAVVLSAVLVPRYLASLPADFLSPHAAKPQHSPLLRVARNLLGVLLLLLGLLMLVLPGQGLLTVLVGLLLVDLPGKHRLIQRVLARPKILSFVNKLRARHHAAPLSAT